LLLLVLFSLFVWFAPLEYRKVVKPDEGRYAEIAREMAESGDWVTPRLNGIKYFEKPPLQYWITAAAYKAFGIHDWTARLWTAVAGFLTLLATYWAGRTLLGPAAGLYGAMVLSSSIYFVLLGHLATLDMGLTLFTTLSLCGFCYAQRDDATPSETRLAMLTTWAAMALAVLSKGLIGVVLPGATLVLYSLIKRDFALWRRLHIGTGVIVFLAIAAPWFVAVSVANPEFPGFFFIHEHLQRFATTEAKREGPVYYFIPILLIGTMPWVFAMGDTLWNTLRRRAPRVAGFDTQLVLLIWTAFIFVFFSISQSKLPSYILPIFPSLALLMGKRLAEVETTHLTWQILPIGLLSVATFFLIAYAVEYGPEIATRPLFERYAHWFYVATAIALIGSIYALHKIRRQSKHAALTTFAVTGLLTAQVAGTGYETLAPIYSTYSLVEKIRPYLKPDIPFYSVRTYDQTLPFYLRRTVTLVDFGDEFSYGIKQQPELVIDSLDKFRNRWRDDADALALMQPKLYEQLRGEGLPMQLLVNDERRVVVRKAEDK
jgi:4-amino-4-deoxy-L-arabinose transferase-like glycosyltransferase